MCSLVQCNFETLTENGTKKKTGRKAAIAAKCLLKVLSVTTQGKKKSLIMSTSLIMYPNSRVRKKKNKIQFVLCAYGHMYLYIQGIEKMWLRRG